MTCLSGANGLIEADVGYFFFEKSGGLPFFLLVKPLLVVDFADFRGVSMPCSLDFFVAICFCG